MKPAFLKRHLETKHANFSTKPAESFQAKRNSLKQQQKLIIKTATVAENALKASYAVSQRIAKCKKAHKFAESLIIPAAVDICKIMLITYVDVDHCCSPTVRLLDNTGKAYPFTGKECC